MKRLFTIALVFLMQFLFSGCVEDEFAVRADSVVLDAEMELSLGTKTGLSGMVEGMYYPLWREGDEIAVYVDTEKDASRFVLNSGNGTTSAEFMGNRFGNSYQALYPYAMAGELVNGELSLVLPGTQQYAAGSFGPDSYPMFAQWKDGRLAFMNLCSVLKISISGEAAIKSITLTARDTTKFLSGAALLKTGYEGEPALEMLAGGSSSVRLECKGVELLKDEPKDFHIVIPSQNYIGGFTVGIDVYTDTIVKQIGADLLFSRSQMRHLKGMQLQAQVPDIIYDAIPDNEIWYISNDNAVAPLAKKVVFGANVVSNTYADGVGIIKFDNPVSTIDAKGGVMFESGAIGKIVLPGKLESIKGNPFRMLPELTEFIGKFASPDGKCLVADGVLCSFAQYGVGEYAVPEGVKSIGPMAFYDNMFLRKIVIPEGVLRIDDEAFYCNKEVLSVLEEVHLPSTLRHMGKYAFARCRSIKKFYGGNGFVSEDGYSIVADNYNSSGKRYLVSFASGAGLTEYSIPQGVEAIENYAFYDAVSLEKLSFPDSCTGIVSGQAFEGAYNIGSISGKYVMEDGRSMVIDSLLVVAACGGLEKYVTPQGANSLLLGVLNHKPNIKEYVLSDDLETVADGESLFLGCRSLEKITVSVRMKSLGYNPFENTKHGTPNLREVYCRAVVPPEITYGSIWNDPVFKFDNLQIYVPKGSLKAYSASSGWVPYMDYLKEHTYTDLSGLGYHFSTDYSMDGVVERLQVASKGDGIDVVLLGDGYSDRQIAQGLYKSDMEFVYDNLFTKEPYKSFKDMFNVSYVNVVSPTEGFEWGNTALSCGFGDGTFVYGNDSKCFEYAQKVVAAQKMDETLVVVVLNSDKYAGTCWMFYPADDEADYALGASVAYFPKGSDESVFAQLLHHEACGHGFAKLADEYAYEVLGAIPAEEVQQIKDQQNTIGWWRNVDFTGDSTAVRWAGFLKDSRYANEGLGVFEGGLTYWTGVWRPTENSIMRHNTGEFNAPSREAIYYKMHKLAYGAQWEYDYEKFVEWDAVNRKSAATRSYVLPLRPQEQLHPPVVVARRWNEM